MIWPGEGDGSGGCHSERVDRTLPSTVTWINPAGGDWDTPGNWLDQSSGINHVPGASDNAVINSSGITIIHNTSPLILSPVSPVSRLSQCPGRDFVGERHSFTQCKLDSGGRDAQGGHVHGQRRGGTGLHHFGRDARRRDGHQQSGPDGGVRRHHASVLDGLTLQGGATIELGNAAGTTYGYLGFQGTETLGGTGAVVFGGRWASWVSRTGPAGS